MNVLDMERAKQIVNDEAAGSPGNSPSPLRKTAVGSLLDKRNQFR